MQNLLSCLRNAPIVQSRLGPCHELRNQIISLNNGIIIDLHKHVDAEQLFEEDKVFKLGLPPKSARENKWGHAGITSPETTYGHYLYILGRLHRAVNTLLNDTFSRGAHIQIDDLPGRQPCGTTVNLAIRDEKLLTTVTFRSMDIVDGYPYDAILFWNYVHLTAVGMLKQAGLIISLGEMTFFVSSLHLYTSDIYKLDLKN